MTRWFLAERYRRYQLTDMQFLVDDANYLVSVLDDNGYRVHVLFSGNRNAIGGVF